MSNDAIIHDLAKEVARMFIENQKDKYKDDSQFPTMVSDYFRAYSIAYSTLVKSKRNFVVN